MDILQITLSVVQVLGVLATVATLVFVWRQTRLLRIQTAEMSKGIRASTYQALISGITELNTVALQDEAVANAYMRVKGLGAQKAEESRERWVVYTLLAHYESIYVQYELGTMPAEIWEAWKTLISNDLALPAFKAIVVTEPYYIGFKRYFGLLTRSSATGTVSETIHPPVVSSASTASPP